jgi:hypothetical protein
VDAALAKASHSVTARTTSCKPAQPRLVCGVSYLPQPSAPKRNFLCALEISASRPYY